MQDNNVTERDFSLSPDSASNSPQVDPSRPQEVPVDPLTDAERRLRAINILREQLDPHKKTGLYALAREHPDSELGKLLSDFDTFVEGHPDLEEGGQNEKSPLQLIQEKLAREAQQTQGKSQIQPGLTVVYQKQESAPQSSRQTSIKRAC